MAKSSRGTRTRRARGDVMEMWQTPKQSWPALIMGVLIRWRVELLVLACLAVFVWWLHGRLEGLAFWAALVAPVAVVLVVPQSRRFVVARFWCVLDRHRIRTCLRTARVRTMNLDGSLPLMLWARPTKTGERIWVWTRAGSSAQELEAALGYVASACFAREAQLQRKRSMSTLVAINVIRRDPLEKASTVSSPLGAVSALVPGRARAGSSAEPVEPITAATVTPVPAPREASSPAAGSAPARTPSPANAASRAQSAGAGRPAVMAGGDDLSDYLD
ncbi:hypothetical protein SAMN06265360_12014 [Haloechinothrix alba]|uniref:Uncharacterized protein n=1 Tax=Haloechinothrix alba TaxID=664784 RepID=A0A238ZAV6_9PSEU|nr:hypothetical protein [Haloechinothrix alba]SNR79923.1 hypothetical protein SAMN06265360_12014 [Haloechinothrix alba]